MTPADIYIGCLRKTFLLGTEGDAYYHLDEQSQRRRTGEFWFLVDMACYLGRLPTPLTGDYAKAMKEHFDDPGAVLLDVPYQQAESALRERLYSDQAAVVDSSSSNRSFDVLLAATAQLAYDPLAQLVIDRAIVDPGMLDTLLRYARSEKDLREAIMVPGDEATPGAQLMQGYLSVAAASEELYEMFHALRDAHLKTCMIGYLSRLRLAAPALASIALLISRSISEWEVAWSRDERDLARRFTWSVPEHAPDVIRAKSFPGLITELRVHYVCFRTLAELDERPAPEGAATI